MWLVALVGTFAGGSLLGAVLYVLGYGVVQLLKYILKQIVKLIKLII